MKKNLKIMKIYIVHRGDVIYIATTNEELANTTKKRVVYDLQMGGSNDTRVYISEKYLE